MSDALTKEKKVVSFPACNNFYHVWISTGERIVCKHCRRHPPQPKVKT